MINSINPYQGLQNAIRPGGSNISRGENKSVLTSGQMNTGVFAGEGNAPSGQAVKIAARISNLQAQLDNLNVVSFPPFFPIAKYQRVELILELNHIQAEIWGSAVPAEAKEIVSSVKLNEDATDQELGDAIGKLFAVNDTLKQSIDVPIENTEPGAILTMKA